MRIVSPLSCMTRAALLAVLTCPASFVLAQTETEKEVPLGEKTAATWGLPSAFGARFSGFLVGSFSYNQRLQMVPEFAGGAAALSDPRSANFRFDKFGLGVSKVFAPWLSAGAAVEIESHRDRHAHGFSPGFGCPGTETCIERFGAEEAEIEVGLDKFNVTGIVPVGHGLSLSIGRFDLPFGLERHDEPLLLTATSSEVFLFGRPNKMTGFQASYTFAPWLDVSAWVVNRWEAEITHEDFNDNNHAKSVGGRIGFTPISRDGLLNIGAGGWVGPERDDDTDDERWVLDFDATWNPTGRLLVAAEAVTGGEESVSFRRRGIPYADPAVVGQDVRWWGVSGLVHYDFADFTGLSFRYGRFKDRDGARTGVRQTLQSFTFTPVFHLSRLIRDLGTTGATFARSRHPIDWVNLKLEYRLNRSNRNVFADDEPAVDIPEAARTGHQFQLQLVVNF